MSWNFSPPEFVLILGVQFSGWSVFLKGHWAQDTFVTNYFPLMLFPVMYLGAKYYYKQPVVRSKDMDFVTNIDEIEADTYVAPAH